MVSIRFGALQPVSIPVEKMDPLDTEVRVIPDNSEEIQRGLVAVNSPDGDIMWGDPDLNEDDDWEVVTSKARKPNRRKYQQPKLKLTDVREVKDDKNRSKKQPKKKEKVPLTIAIDRLPKARMKGSGHPCGPPEIQESNKTTPQMKTKSFHHAT